MVEGIFRIDRAREEVALERQRMNVLMAQPDNHTPSIG